MDTTFKQLPAKPVSAKARLQFSPLHSSFGQQLVLISQELKLLLGKLPGQFLMDLFILIGHIFIMVQGKIWFLNYGKLYVLLF